MTQYTNLIQKGSQQMITKLMLLTILLIEPFTCRILILQIQELELQTTRLNIGTS